MFPETDRRFSGKKIAGNTEKNQKNIRRKRKNPLPMGGIFVILRGGGDLDAAV
jgi:hypothetical protein